MSLVRALVPACLALSVTLGAAADLPTPGDPLPVTITADPIQERGIRVLAALLVALTAGGTQGVTAPQGKIAEVERLLAGKFFQELPREKTSESSFSLKYIEIENNNKHNSYSIKLTDLNKRKTITASFANLQDVTMYAINYSIFHTFSGDRPIAASPTSSTFAAPCDYKTRFGWPCTDASEGHRDQLVRWMGEGEIPKLSKGLYRRRCEVVPDVTLGQETRPSADRMNLYGFASTNGPALYIGER